MRPLFILVVLCLPILANGQLVFEEVLSPEDLSIQAVRKSPVGEYFIQTTNDRRSIYTSQNGQDWIRTPMPETDELDDIDFYADGTPVLKPERDVHLIRRDGEWFTLYIPGVDEIKASFIRDDTLFAYVDQTFAYSLDKGRTFTIAFVFGETIVDHTSSLWKFGSHYILHHTAGASDHLSVFSMQGQRVLYRELSIGIPTILHNSCGEVLFINHNNYYLFEVQGLVLTSGSSTQVHPDFDYNTSIFSQDGMYYVRIENTIYRSTGCHFTWGPLVTHDLVGSMDQLWVNHDGSLCLYQTGDNLFLEDPDATNTWEEHMPGIDYADVRYLHESANGHQAAMTANAAFSKTIQDAHWIELDSSIENNYRMQYAPNGDLYINRGNDILYSQDNGATFTTIVVPEAQFSDEINSMYILDDGMIFIIYSFLGQCFYTLNNGYEWIEANTSFPYLTYPIVKLVDNKILMAELDFDFRVTEIHLGTNEITSETPGNFVNLSLVSGGMLDDGTILFYAYDLDGVHPEGLYQYRFGEEAEFLGAVSQIWNTQGMMTSGQELYMFGPNEYYQFNGSTFESGTYSGLPQGGLKNFILAENEHLYCTVDGHRIYRSVKPLSYPRFITGTVFHDAGENCIPDTSESKLAYWQVKVEGDEYMRIRATNANGDFQFSVPDGEYTVSCQPVNAYWELCEAEFLLTVNADDPTVRQDFRASAGVSCAELELDFSTPLLRRCFENYYSFRVRNTGPEAGTGATVRVELDPFFVDISATLPFTEPEPGVLEFDLGVLEVNAEILFRIFFTLSCDAELGMEHCISGRVFDDNICGSDRADYTECQTNIGSFDPNDKRVFNQKGQEAQRIDKGEYAYYHIRFQNTGTDTAFNVRIEDKLSPRLDVSTLEMLSASHPYTYSLTEGPALVVLFEDVLLPDSTTNEPASHGFFKFRVKPLAEFDYGTSIPNEADIYFDYNDAVRTNEALLTILPPVSTQEAGGLVRFDVFPNPATRALYIRISETDRKRVHRLEIVDHLGRVVQVSDVRGGQPVHVADLVSGMYSVILRESGTAIGIHKFVKQ